MDTSLSWLLLADYPWLYSMISSWSTGHTFQTVRKCLSLFILAQLFRGHTVLNQLTWPVIALCSAYNHSGSRLITLRLWIPQLGLLVTWPRGQSLCQAEDHTKKLCWLPAKSTEQRGGVEAEISFLF